MLRSQFVIIGIALTAPFLSGCRSQEVRVTDGTEVVGSAPTGSLFLTSDASLVHVDQNARVATIGNGSRFADGTFLIASDSSDGQQTGVLKISPSREIGLRTAEIVEGEPQIGNDLNVANSRKQSEFSTRFGG